MSHLRVGYQCAFLLLAACSGSEGVLSETPGQVGENNDTETGDRSGREQARTSSGAELDADESADLADSDNAGDETGAEDTSEPDGAGAAEADGAGGTSGSSADQGGSGGATQTGASCPEPAGQELAASSYSPPATAAGCNLGALPALGASEVSATLTSEEEFRAFFACPEQAASGIDFAAQRLRVSVVREAGFIAPTREHAVIEGGVVTLAFSLPAYCGGAFPPSAVALTLLPAGAGEVREELCRRGDCGAGGFPP